MQRTGKDQGETANVARTQHTHTPYICKSCVQRVQGNAPPSVPAMLWATHLHQCQQCCGPRETSCADSTLSPPAGGAGNEAWDDADGAGNEACGDGKGCHDGAYQNCACMTCHGMSWHTHNDDDTMSGTQTRWHVTRGTAQSMHEHSHSRAAKPCQEGDAERQWRGRIG